MKRNRFLFIAVVLISLFFTSCIDYIQSMSYTDGQYHLYYKVTLSKLLMELGDSDPEELFSDFDEEMMEGLPENVKIKPVNTELEVGAEFSIEADPKTADEDQKSLLPTVSGKNCYIPFLLGKEESSFADSMDSMDGDTENIVKAILSSAKCRILISKKIIPLINNAYFEGVGSQNYSIPVFDYGDSYCFEIPFMVLFEKGMYKFNHIVVVKG